MSRRSAPRGHPKIGPAKSKLAAGLLAAAIAALLHPAFATGQETPARDSVGVDPVTPAMSPVVRPDSAGTETQEERRGPSPMGAFFRSVLVPGWGQLYADQPVRGVVYLALQSATVFMVIRTNNRIDDAESDELKDARRAQREDWLVLAGFWALASGIDAWVSAQMWGFEGEVVPPPDGSPGAALQVSVPFGGF